MDVFELSPREFRSFLEEERQYRTPEQIDNLMRRYNQANSLSGKLSGLLAPQEGRRRTSFFPASVPEGMSLFDAFRAGEAELAVPQGIIDMVTGTVRGVENPTLAAQGRIPAADMNAAGFEAAAAAMGLASLFGKVPSDAVGANMLRSGKMTAPTETGWTFRDVKAPNLSKEDNRKVYEALSVPRGYEVELPIRRLFATQDKVNPDFATTTSSEGRIPTVIRKDGEFFVRDGHHRLTKQSEAGNQNAKVWLYDLDNQNRDTPLLDYEPPKQLSQKEMDKVESYLAELGLLDETLSANASKSAGLLSVASDVSARGDQILNMLKSGRGSEVTDAMLDMGDGVKNTQLNQYLAENYDLPMDEVSRLARAREMGFEGGLLHGTGSDITTVDPAKLGGKQNVLGKGFYQTTNPERSDRYVPKEKGDDGSLIFAEGGNVMPLMTKSADEFDLTVPTGKENITRIANAFEGSDYDVELRDGGDSVFIQSKTNPSMSVFLDSYSEGQNTLMRLKDAFGNNNITPILQEAGFTGVKGVESRGSNVRVNYNPQDVRTQFARFDPRLSHLSNVTAANASPISGLLAQSGVSSEQAQRIEDYLYRTGLLQ